MAEINLPKRGNRKLQAPRIDLTPMVDLGFLLISFFMFTTTLAKPNTMEINMPSNEHNDRPPEIPSESTITLIPVSGHSIIYYEGMLNGIEQMKKCPITQIRDILLSKKQEAAALPSTFSAAAHKVYVLIKPGDNCTYGDVVQLLDEMNILDISFYTIMDLVPEEKDMVAEKY